MIWLKCSENRILKEPESQYKILVTTRSHFHEFVQFRLGRALHCRERFDPNQPGAPGPPQQDRDDGGPELELQLPGAQLQVLRPRGASGRGHPLQRHQQHRGQPGR